MNKYSKYVNTDELKKERKKNGLSIMNMANLMGFRSKVAYYNIEIGATEPKISHINKISSILKKSPQNFFNFTEDNIKSEFGGDTVSKEMYEEERRKRIEAETTLNLITKMLVERK